MRNRKGGPKEGLERAHFGSLQEGMCLVHPDTPRTPSTPCVIDPSLVLGIWSLVLGDKAQSGFSFVSLVWVSLVWVSLVRVSLLSSPTEISDSRITE